MPNCNKLHPSVITDLDSLTKLDNLWLYSDQPIFADTGMVLQLDNPCSLELVNLQTIRFKDSPTLTIRDANGNDIYVTQPMLMDDNNASVGGNTTTDWRNVINHPTTLSDYEVTSADTLFDSKYLKLTGGALTGSLSGTTASFTGTISEGGSLLSNKYIQIGADLDMGTW